MWDFDRLPWWAVSTALCLAIGCAGGASLLAAEAELRLVQQDGKAVPEAVLVVYALDGRALPAPAPAVMDQRDRRFVPRVLPVQTGAQVTFPNSDNVSHHVYSFSPPKRFQLYLAKGGPPQSVVFDRAGVETLGCNLHDWMLGYILVVDTPYFAVTDDERHGRASPASPPGATGWRSGIRAFPDSKDRYAREVRLEEGDAGGAGSSQLERPLLPARDQKPGFVEY